MFSIPTEGLPAPAVVTVEFKSIKCPRCGQAILLQAGELRSRVPEIICNVVPGNVPGDDGTNTGFGPPTPPIESNDHPAQKLMSQHDLLKAL